TPVPEPAATPETRVPTAAAPTQAPAAAAAEATSRGSGQRVPPPAPGRRSSSRRGGGIFLALALVVVVAVVIIVIATSGGSSPKKSTTTKAGTTPTTPSTTTPSTTTTTASGVKPKIVAKIVLRPTSSSSKALGAADVVTEGKVTGVIVRAIHLTPNTTHNAYAVWLATPGGAAHLLGYVSPAVGKSGALQTSGQLPSNVASYKLLLITLETTANTKSPGPAVLAGNLSLR
ncbi:MAG TPA: hypothetical protein VG275_03680, partial [Solirubrobacteraceae bacterium]|nr:hypothetical protein [Solirubrobacteraceae bacterium]